MWSVGAVAVVAVVAAIFMLDEPRKEEALMIRCKIAMDALEKRLVDLESEEVMKGLKEKEAYDLIKLCILDSDYLFEVLDAIVCDADLKSMRKNLIDRLHELTERVEILKNQF